VKAGMTTAAEKAAGTLRAVAGYSLINLFGNAARIGLSFATVVLASRWMGANDFGEANLLLAYTGYLMYILTLGFDNGIPYFMGRGNRGKPNSGGRLLATGAGLSLAVGSVIMLASVAVIPRVLEKAGMPGLFWPAFLLVVQCEFGAIGYLLDGYLRGSKRFVPVIIRDQIMFPFLNLAGLFVLVRIMGRGVLGFSLAYALSVFVSMIYGTFVCIRVAVREKGADPPGNWSSWLGFSFPLALMSTMDPLLYSSGVIIAGLYLDTGEVAKYVVSVRVAIFCQFFVMALGPVFSPYIADMHGSGKRDEMGNLYRTAINWSSKWALLFGFFVVAAAEFVLSVFGAGYSDAVLCLLLVMPGAVIEGSLGSSRLSLVMTGKNRINVTFYSIAILVNVVAGVLLVPRLGLTGLALAFSLSYGIMNLLRIGWFFRSFGVKPLDRSQLAGLAVLLVLLAAVALGIRRLDLSPGGAALLAGLVFMLGLAAVFWEDRKLFLDRFLRAVSRNPA